MQFLSADDSSGQVATWCERLHSEDLQAGKEAAQKVLKKYGKGIAGPHSDFDWGFLQGKRSAIRWVLGDE